MTKFMLTAGLVLALGAGAASAQEYAASTPAAPSGAVFGLSHQQFANLHRERAFGLGTASAYSRNVGPGSVVGGFVESPLGNANSGFDVVPGAPSATNLNGGSH